MRRTQFIAWLIFIAAFNASAQSIYQDRDVREGLVYAFKTPDGVMNYSSKPPGSGSYRAIAYYSVNKTGRNRMNGLLCESDCSAERQAYQQARDHQITDEKNCPLAPRASAAGCKLWVQEGK